MTKRVLQLLWEILVYMVQQVVDSLSEGKQVSDLLFEIILLKLLKGLVIIAASTSLAGV